MSAEFTVEGDVELMKKVAQLLPVHTKAAKEGMWEWGWETIAEAQSLAPIEHGDLIASGFVDDVEEIPQGLLLRLGFSVAYALVQHERMDFHHPRGGQAKYLEIPVIMRSPKLLEKIAAYLEAAQEARL